MRSRPTRPLIKTLIWVALATAIAAPIIAAAFSPQLAWRQPIYIAAGFSGIIAMALLLIQPLLAGGYLPDLNGMRARRLHRAIGIALVLAVLIHVGALWITSPPDVVDALLLVSPTPFSVWGVLAMWAVFASALLAARRKKVRVRTWRLLHTVFALVIVAGTITHALLIQGTMEIATKIGLSVLIALATTKALLDLRVWIVLRRTRS